MVLMLETSVMKISAEVLTENGGFMFEVKIR